MLTLYARVTDVLDDIAHWLTPTAARLLFAAVLFVYYWNSGLTKLGDGVFGFLFPSTGAYIQIFPKTVEIGRAHV